MITVVSTLLFLLLPLVSGRGAAAIVTQNSTTETDESRALSTGKTRPSQQVVNITRHWDKRIRGLLAGIRGTGHKISDQNTERFLFM